MFPNCYGHPSTAENNRFVCLFYSAVKVGSTKPLLALAFPKTVTKLDSKWAKPESLCLATILAALEALYVPLEVREFSDRPRPESLKPVKSTKVEYLGWFAQSDHGVDHDQLVSSRLRLRGLRMLLEHFFLITTL
ncbi:putative aminopeptidase W07G4.4 [Fasciola gigantica]|uniref:Putative aminopeptidase W07G4.4 n=1 Tax=Fasciola gigantica TaxID=46835 RepID=A0A504YZM7_FASGI|nr:putative aminopeptidase W07G4.4 [Fasciola gigantica]